MASAYGLQVRPISSSLSSDKPARSSNLLSTRWSDSAATSFPQSGHSIASEPETYFTIGAGDYESVPQGIGSLSNFFIGGSPSFNDFALSRTGLGNLPIEVFARVCGHLDAVWVYNLAHVSSELFHRLNGPHANRIWYSILPKALWRKTEKHQCDVELNKWAAIYHEKTMRQRAIAEEIEWENRWRLQSLLTESMPEMFESDSRPLILLPASDNSLSEPNERSDASHSELALSSNFSASDTADAAPWVTTQFDLWMPPLSPQTPQLQPVSPLIPLPQTPPMGILSEGSLSTQGIASIADLMPEVAQRLTNIALGGPYQPLFSYKREIVGHLAARARCSICFNRDRFHNKKPVSIKIWGLMWCKECLYNHTITYEQIKELVKHINRANIGKRFAFPFRQHFRTVVDKHNRLHFLTSEVSRAFTSHGCNDVEIETLSKYATAARQEYKNKRDNAERRHVRSLIVLAAEGIWSGQDPVKDLVKPGMMLYREYQMMSFDSMKYALWRDRFAPTQKLRDFLFPPYLLEEQALPFERPTVNAVLMNRYPNDPLDNIHLRTVRSLMHEPAWIVWHADRMIKSLVDFQSSLFKTPGYGGSCTTWNGAIRDHHRRRLEAELDKAIHNGDLLPFAYKTRPDRSTIAQRLRIEEVDIVKQANLKDADKQRGLRSLFAGPSMFEPYKEAVNSVYDRVLALREQEMDFDNRLRHAKKIFLATCKRCPANRLNVNKKGIEAILDHMRDAHPEMWWCSDDWFIVG